MSGPWDEIIDGPEPAPPRKKNDLSARPVGNLRVSKTMPTGAMAPPPDAPPAEFEDPREQITAPVPLIPVLPSKLDGVYRYGQNKFRAVRKINGKAQHLGVYDTAEEAHEAWNKSVDGDFYKNEFRPSLRQRQLVQDLAVMGLPQAKIAAHIINPDTNAPIGNETLLRHFGHELGEGMNQGDRETVQSMHLHLHGRPPTFWLDANGQYILDKTGKPIVLRQELRPNVAATIFMAKVRPGIALRDTTVIEHTRPVEDEVYAKLKSLPREKLLEVRDALRRATAIEGPDSDAEGSG